MGDPAEVGPALRLLVVEDRPEDVELIQRALRREGLAFETRVVQSAMEFREALAWEPDIVLSDYHLPGFGALQALELLQATAPGTPFIVVSGSIGEELAVDAIRRGAADYILKDRLGRLASAVRAQLERSRLERERDESQRRLHDLQETIDWALRNSKISIWDWWVEEDRVEASDNWATMLGYEPGEVMPSAGLIFESVHPDDLENLQAAVERCLEGPSDYLDVAYRFRGASGAWIWIEAVGTVRTRDAAGRGTRVAGVNVDITDSQRVAEEARSLQTQLIHAQKMEAIGKLAGGVAHDFNNLLTVINGFCDLLLNRHSSGEFRSDLEEVRRAGEKASQLTRQLLVLSRRQVTKPELVELGPFVQQSSRLLQRLLPDNVDFSVSLDCEGAQVDIDPTHLDQILLNLVVNSRDALAAKARGKIQLEVSRVDLPRASYTRLGPLPAGRYTRIAVVDDGAGIDPADLDRIFEPFFTTKGSEEGTGLGLSTVYAIVRQVEGGIAIESRPGGGARFDVFLPLATGNEGRRGEAAPGDALELRAVGRVLVVEDDPNVRTLICRFLEGAGLVTSPARSFDEGLARLESEEFALVVSDVVLPERSGVEFEAELERLGLDIPLLLVTGYVDEVFTRRQRRIRARVLEKPFTRSQLLEQVGELLALSG